MDSRIRIAIVEDNDMWRKAIEDALALDGRFSLVGSAADGETGVELLTNNRVDVALMDIALPKKDGLFVLEELNKRLAFDPFLGKGTLTVSEIFFNSPSRCAVADMCAISIDRRLTVGENDETSLNEIRALPSVQKYGAVVSMYQYDSPSWTGELYETECYFPTWVIPSEHPACIAMVEAHRKLYGEPKVDKWTFSTNGVSIMGRYGIPCIGFGPGREEEAHAPNEKTWKADLVRCAAVYAAMPKMYIK